MKFVIPIIPVAQMRDRIGTITRRDGTSKAMSFKHKTQKLRDDTLIAFLARHAPAEPMAGPLLLGFKAYLLFPKTKPKWFDGTAAEFRAYAASGVLRPPVKPDKDNLEKQLCDCLTACRYWHDDAQIVGTLPHSGKFYSDSPRWEVEIIPYDWRKAAQIRG